MKKSYEITELPIVSITDGKEVGRVKSLVINPEEGHVDFLTIEHKDWQVSMKAIPFKKVIGVGEYAVTIESTTSILDLDEIPIANELINKKVKLIGSKVMTRKGQLVGEVTEFFVNDDTGQIVAAEVKTTKERLILESDAVVTFSEQMTIITEDALTKSVTTIESLTGESTPVESEVGSTVQEEETSVTQKEPESENVEERAVEEKPATETVIQDVQPQLQVVENKSAIKAEEDLIDFHQQYEEIEEEESLQEEATTNVNVSKLAGIHEKQLQLLKGKVVQKDIVDTRGNVLFNKGETLTEDDVKLAQDQGPSVVVDLTMSVEG